MEKYISVRLIEAFLLLVSFCVLSDNFCDAVAPFKYPVKYHGHRIHLHLPHLPHLHLRHSPKLSIRPYVKLLDPTTPIHHHHHHHHHDHPHDHPLHHDHPHPHDHPLHHDHPHPHDHHYHDHPHPNDHHHHDHPPGPFRPYGKLPLGPPPFPRGSKFIPPGGNPYPTHPNSLSIHPDGPPPSHSHPESIHEILDSSPPFSHTESISHSSSPISHLDGPVTVSISHSSPSYGSPNGPHPENILDSSPPYSHPHGTSPLHSQSEIIPDPGPPYGSLDGPDPDSLPHSGPPYGPPDGLSPKTISHSSPLYSHPSGPRPKSRTHSSSLYSYPRGPPPSHSSPPYDSFDGSNPESLPNSGPPYSPPDGPNPESLSHSSPPYSPPDSGNSLHADYDQVKHLDTYPVGLTPGYSPGPPRSRPESEVVKHGAPEVPEVVEPAPRSVVSKATSSAVEYEQQFPISYLETLPKHKRIYNSPISKHLNPYDDLKTVSAPIDIYNTPISHQHDRYKFNLESEKSSDHIDVPEKPISRQRQHVYVYTPEVEKEPTPIDVHNTPIISHQQDIYSYPEPLLEKQPGFIDIHNTPISPHHEHDHHNSDQLLRNLPRLVDLYGNGHPSSKKVTVKLDPVEKVIRNVKLNEFICVKKVEGDKDVVLSAVTKTTFYVDQDPEGPKTIQVANTQEKLCLHGIPKDGRRASALDCNGEDPLLKWDLVPIHYGQFWIKQKGTNHCLQPSSSFTNPLFVEMKACDLYEPLQLWDVRDAHPTKDIISYGTY